MINFKEKILSFSKVSEPGDPTFSGEGPITETHIACDFPGIPLSAPPSPLPPDLCMRILALEIATLNF